MITLVDSRLLERKRSLDELVPIALRHKLVVVAELQQRPDVFSLTAIEAYLLGQGLTSTLEGMNPREVDRRLDGHRGLRMVLMSALIVLVSGLVLWGIASRPSSVPRSAEEREVAAGELLAGIRISTSLSGATLAASKALVDFLAENDVRLVLVRIVEDLELEIRIETDQAVRFREPPSLCLIGPYSAPDDAGYSSPCWGTPDMGALLAAQLPSDGAGHAMFPAGRAIALPATLQRGGHRCDYPPGRWLLVVEANPLVDGTPMGARQLAEIAFEIPWSNSSPLPFLPVKTVAYCGLANIVYKEQGAPQIASPSP